MVLWPERYRSGPLAVAPGAGGSIDAMDGPPELLDAAREAVAALLADPRSDGRRVIVGLAGPPAAGKSTLATALAAALCQAPPRGLGDGAAVAVPMDGFHLSNVELDRLGLADRKGAPETFDAAGFVHLLGRIRDGCELVYAPAYSRVLHESIGGVIPVFPHARVVVVEGNYLLVSGGAWAGVRPLLDLAIYVEAPQPVRIDSLLRRQRSRGLDSDRAHDWVHRSDEANARLIEQTRRYADLVLSRTS
jgi:pantothenate kinase